jgi:hypothetical protein
MCARLCTLGHLPSCGWDGTASTSYACIVAQAPTQAGYGDGGYCGELCDCDDDCTDPWAICLGLASVPGADRPWAATVVAQSGRAGVCTDPDDAPGGSPGIPCVGGAGGAGGSSAGGSGGAGGGSVGGGGAAATGGSAGSGGS